MKIEDDIPLLEEIISDWKSVMGAEYQGYRNHVYRMIHFCFALRDCSDEEREKIIIAGVFHDIGIWAEETMDYISPSLPLATAYLESRGLESWSEEIKLMITEHHKIRECDYDVYPLVELFRKGDLVDFSLGLFKFGVPKTYVQEVKDNFPNASFHKNIAKRVGKWFLKHPLNPAPMMKW